MRTVIKAKFDQNPDLLQRLRATGNAHLVEHTQNDAFWGDGSNGPTIGPGQNMLGQILMQFRDNPW